MGKKLSLKDKDKEGKKKWKSCKKKDKAVQDRLMEASSIHIDG